MSAHRVQVARVEEIPEPGAIVRAIGSTSIILARRNGRVFAYENRCPHAGDRLERPDGRMVVQEGRFMICMGHGASFTLDGGACAGGPCDGEGLTPVAVEIVDGAVLIDPASCSDRPGGA